MLPPERKRERDSWILLPVNPTWSHQVRRQREGEGKTNSLSSSIQTQKLSASLCHSVCLPLSQPCPNESRIIIKHVNMLIKNIYIYLTLTTIFVGLFVCSQDYLWMTLLEQKGAVEWSGSWQTQWEKWCFHMYTLTGLWEQNGLIHSLGCLPYHLSAVKLLQRTRMREGERRYNIFIILGCYIYITCLQAL